MSPWVLYISALFIGIFFIWGLFIVSLSIILINSVSFTGLLEQTLTIKHDSINRESFMPAVIESVKFVIKSNKFTIGLENIMKLK